MRHSMTHTARKYVSKICSIAWIKVLNIIYNEDTSQSLYTDTLYFIHLSSCDDNYRC